MFLTADVILCHLVGDYLLQSDWMATAKSQKNLPAYLHAVTYTLPFLFLTFSWKALLFIAATHYLIDRNRLARYVCWVKNFLAPRYLCSRTTGELVRNYPWEYCEATGYPKDRPIWLTVWLMIITDNCLHLICNGIALRWL